MTERQREDVRAGYDERYKAAARAIEELRRYVDKNIPDSKTSSCMTEASKAIFTADAYARNALGILLDEKKDKKE